MFEPPGSPEEEKLSEFGSFLAREIERRIRLVFGEAPHVRLCREQDDSSDEEISGGISERKKIENTAGFWDLCWADVQIVPCRARIIHSTIPETWFLLRNLEETNLFRRSI